MKKLTYPSPGNLLLTEFIQPMDLTQYRVAKDCGIAHSAMTQIIRGKRTITAETALRLGCYFGTTPQFWLNLQTEYDLRQARKTHAEIERQVKPFH